MSDDRHLHAVPTAKESADPARCRKCISIEVNLQRSESDLRGLTRALNRDMAKWGYLTADQKDKLAHAKEVVESNRTLDRNHRTNDHGGYTL